MAAGVVPGVRVVVMGLRDLRGLSVVCAPQCLLLNPVQENTLRASKKLDASKFNLPVRDCIEIGAGPTIAGGQQRIDSSYTPELSYTHLQT